MDFFQLLHSSHSCLQIAICLALLRTWAPQQNFSFLCQHHTCHITIRVGWKFLCGGGSLGFSWHTGPQTTVQCLGSPYSSGPPLPAIVPRMRATLFSSIKCSLLLTFQCFVHLGLLFSDFVAYPVWPEAEYNWLLKTEDFVSALTNSLQLVFTLWLELPYTAQLKWRASL